MYRIGVALVAAALVVPLSGPAIAAPADDQGDGRAQAGIEPGGVTAQQGGVSAASAADNFPIRGIDVSKHDHAKHNVNWPALAASGVKFAYIKATEGTTYTNPYFAADYQAARNAGLYVGAYVFVRPDKNNPVAQADHFVDTSRWLPDTRTLVPMVDLEWPYFSGVNSCYNRSTAGMSAWIRTFVDRIESRIGRKPMIYTNRNWWNPCTGNDTSFGDYPLNVASYTSSLPRLPAGWSTFTMWQYRAGNPNVAGDHDRDVFNGDLAGLAALAGPSAAKVISLRAHANGSFVTTGGGGTNPLIANRGFPDAWERFDVIDPSPGQSAATGIEYVALRSQANGRYVTAESAGTRPLAANRLAIGDWEKFQIVENDDGTVSLLAAANGRYVTAERGGARPLIANRTANGTWERFDQITPGTPVALRARINSSYVSAEWYGRAPLIANRGAVGTWERYDKIVLGNGLVALRAHANGRYVTAEHAGAAPLIARGTAIGVWELFRIVDNGDGSVGLRSAANGRYVSADGGGARPLIANRTAIETGERFDLAG